MRGLVCIEDCEGVYSLLADNRFRARTAVTDTDTVTVIGTDRRMLDSGVRIRVRSSIRYGTP